MHSAASCSSVISVRIFRSASPQIPPLPSHAYAIASTMASWLRYRLPANSLLAIFVLPLCAQPALVVLHPSPVVDLLHALLVVVSRHARRQVFPVKLVNHPLNPALNLFLGHRRLLVRVVEAGA